MVAAAATAAPLVNHRRRERIFFSGMAVLIIVTVLAGFSRTFYLRPYFHPQPLLPLLIFHGIVMSSWLALFITQTTLVATRRINLHRRLGVAGGILAVLMVLLGSFVGIVRAKILDLPPGSPPPLTFLTIPLGDMLVFAILVGAAFYFRRQLDTHKRLMLIATIGILPAAVARLPLAFVESGGPFVFFGLSDAFILPLLIFDFVTRGRPHRATILGALLLISSHPLRLIIGGTHAWLAFATWLTSWVG
ncbi:MAG TPA: hypothetical protein VLL54_10790 [Pyrinomonadaceae bacterium]|nr:hypothetical protein [Pyrinomonadaceae bacterium]